MFLILLCITTDAAVTGENNLSLLPPSGHLGAHYLKTLMKHFVSTHIKNTNYSCLLITNEICCKYPQAEDFTRVSFKRVTLKLFISDKIDLISQWNNSLVTASFVITKVKKCNKEQGKCAN